MKLRPQTLNNISYFIRYTILSVASTLRASQEANIIQKYLIAVNSIKMSQVAAKVLASAARQVSKTVPQVSYQFFELSALNRCRQLYNMEAILFQSKTMLGENDIIKSA